MGGEGELHAVLRTVPPVPGGRGGKRADLACGHTEKVGPTARAGDLVPCPRCDREARARAEREKRARPVWERVNELARRHAPPGEEG